MEKERSNTLDALKLLLSFMVVIIHCHCIYNNTISPILRIAVPTFFAISGYFIGFQKDKITHTLKKTIVILLWSTLLYGILFIYRHYNNVNTLDYTQILINLFIYNTHPFIYHLWYINAYIYVLIITLFLTRHKTKTQYIFILIPVLILFNLILGRYSYIIFGVDFGVKFLPPFLFSGLPFYLMGAYLKKKLRHPISIKHYFFICTCVLLLFAERALFKLSGGDMYIFSSILVYVIMLYSVNNNIKNNVFASLGKKYALFIYVLHPFVIDVFLFLLNKTNIKIGTTLFSYIYPLVIFLVTLLLAYFIQIIKSSTKNENKHFICNS